MPSRMPDPLFRRLDTGAAQLVEIRVDGRTMTVPEGAPLAAALLAAGHQMFHRSARAGQPRGPLCLMGSCFACVARIDGAANQRTCRTVARAGMVVELHAPEAPETAA
jgi:predicted molibdopterin-dependent oxidoreductase YjgC